jgi:hypothetical protein
MMNTDLLHRLHHQRHQKLWAEAERERAQRDVAGAQTTSAYTRLTTWLRRFSTRRMPVALSGRAR